MQTAASYTSKSIRFTFEAFKYRALKNTYNLKNTVISRNFLVWKFCGKAQFLYSFVRIDRNYTETMIFHKVSTPGN